MGSLGLATTEAAKALSHTFSFALTLTVLTNLCQFTILKCCADTHRRPLHRRYAPAILVCASVPLIMADLTRHVLQDAGIWPAGHDRWSSSMYRSPVGQCSADNDTCRVSTDDGGYGLHRPWTCDAQAGQCVCPEASVRCLTWPVGVLFTVVSTYAGMACLVAGVLLGSNALSKIREQLARRSSRRGRSYVIER